MMAIAVCDPLGIGRKPIALCRTARSAKPLGVSALSIVFSTTAGCDKAAMICASYIETRQPASEATLSSSRGARPSRSHNASAAPVARWLGRSEFIPRMEESRDIRVGRSREPHHFDEVLEADASFYGRGDRALERGGNAAGGSLSISNARNWNNG